MLAKLSVPNVFVPAAPTASLPCSLLSTTKHDLQSSARHMHNGNKQLVEKRIQSIAGRTSWRRPWPRQESTRLGSPLCCQARDNAHHNGEESSCDLDAVDGPDPMVDANDEFVATLNNMLSIETSFDGVALATLIRQKWGKSYDVRFQKQTFLGKEIWALNVMWKFIEQSSFPMTEERYLEHLQATVDVLRDMGAISLVRSALLATTEKPRVGKAVCIQIAINDV